MYGLFYFYDKKACPRKFSFFIMPITFGSFTENKQWKAFRERLLANGYELEFLHKDEFQKSYKSKFGHAFTYPIILVETPHDLEVLVTTEKLNGYETVEELVAAVQGSVGSFQ